MNLGERRIPSKVLIPFLLGGIEMLRSEVDFGVICHVNVNAGISTDKVVFDG